MQYRVCEKDAIRVVGVKIPIVEDYEKNMMLIPQFWKRTLGTKHFAKICALADQEPYGALGVSAYFDPQHIYYYIAVVTDQPAPAGLEEFFIPAATWCVVTGNPCGSATHIDMFRGFFTEFLPASGMEYAELPDIEVYPLNGGGNTVEVKEMWFSIKQAD